MILIPSGKAFYLGGILIVGLLALHGCAQRPPPSPSEQTRPPITSPPVSTPEPTITRRPQPAAPQADPTPYGDPIPQADPPPSKPVATLLAKAETEFKAGQLDRSAASIERAIRISPRTPVLWQRLAQIHLVQGEARQAEAMALKSNSLVSPESSLLRKNWEIIAEARRLMGDKEGARQAKEQARPLDAR